MRSTFVILALLTLAGCAGSVRLHPADQAVLLQQGIVYYLPVTRLKITVPYTVVDERVWNIVPRAEWEGRATRAVVKHDAYGRPVVVDAAGVALKLVKDDKPVVPDAEQYVLEQKSPPRRQLRVREGVAVTPVTVADRRMVFRIDPASLRAFTIAVDKAKISLSPEGILQGVNVEFQDRKAEMAAGWVKTGLAIAKLAGAVGGRELREETVIKVVEITREIGFDECDAAPGVPKDGVWRLTYRVEPRFGEFGAVVGSAAAFDAAARDGITVEVQADRDLKQLSCLASAAVTALPPWHGAPDRRVLDGILFRVPAPVQLTVSVEDVPVLTTSLAVAQAGGLACVPIRSRPFTDRQFGLKVSETTGGATEYTFSGSSAGERTATAPAPSANAASDALKELDSAAVQREIDRLKKQKELLDARRALENAREVATE